MKTVLPASLMAAALFVTGCLSPPYRPPIPKKERVAVTPPGEAQFERGRTNTAVDAIGWVFGIPGKIILLDRRVDNHHIGTKVEADLADYLATNGLDDVKVRLNQYSPGAEWRRLVRNRNVGAGWRYSVGVLSWLFYTVLPGRVLGGDSYNPYTDTISLYSDIPAIGLHEGGHSKDFYKRTYPGTYGVAYMLPFFALYPEALASSDAMTYLHTSQTAEEEKEGYKLLYPAYSTYIGGNLVGGNVLLAPAFYVGVAAGHVIGRYEAAQVDSLRAGEGR